MAYEDLIDRKAERILAGIFGNCPPPVRLLCSRKGTLDRQTEHLEVTVVLDRAYKDYKQQHGNSGFIARKLAERDTS